MKHYIIAKFNEGCDWKPMIGAITDLFEETLQIPGIHAVKVKPCCINRPNRYDVMIEMEMDPEALTEEDDLRQRRLINPYNYSAAPLL